MNGHRPDDHPPGHGHRHGAGHGETPTGTRGRLALVLALNAVFLVVEVGGGLRFSSLALLADSAHMASDVFGLVLALGAQTLLLRPPSGRHTFGLIRSEVLAAQANAVLTAVAGLWVLAASVGRLSEPPPVEGAGVAVVALGGLAVNLLSVRLLFGLRHHSLNLRGAFLHMAADAAGSVAALTAGLAAALGSAFWVDPAVSLLIGLLVVWSAWGLLRSTVHVLLEGAPADIRGDDVRRALQALPEVTDVHHLHLWYLASSSVALSGHVMLAGEPSLHEAQAVGDRIRALLAAEFGIRHATLELECHRCEPVPVGAGPAGTALDRCHDETGAGPDHHHQM